MSSQREVGLGKLTPEERLVNALTAALLEAAHADARNAVVHAKDPQTHLAAVQHLRKFELNKDAKEVGARTLAVGLVFQAPKQGIVLAMHDKALV